MKKKNLVALITGADQQTAYATARALANLDVQLIGLCTNANSRFSRSRLWNQVITVNRNMDAHLEKLICLGKSSSNKIVLLPTQDNVVQLLSDNRHELKKYYQFVYPQKSTVDLLMDKTKFHQWAIDQGFPVPESHIVESHSELNVILDKIRFPVILKPLFRTDDWIDKSPHHKIIKLDNRRHIENIAFDLFKAAPNLLVQRWIPGGDSNVHFCLIYVDRDGHELAYYTGRKLLQWPILTGSTAIAVGSFDHQVHKLAKEVLLKAELNGLGSLEVKKSDEDNKYYITEPTIGRNDYQSYLAVAGGVNLTQVAFSDAINEPRQVFIGERQKATWIEEDFACKAIRYSIHHKKVCYGEILMGLSRKISLASLNLNDPLPFFLLLGKLLDKPIVYTKECLKKLIKNIARRLGVEIRKYPTCL